MPQNTPPRSPSSAKDRQAWIVAAYGLAHYGKSLFWYVSELFFAFYLTEMAGLPPQHMGLVLGLGLVASAALDGTVAWRFGRFMHDAEAAGRLQFVGAVLSAIALILVFVADSLPAEWRFAYAIAVGLGFRVAYASYDLPQNALLSLRDWPRLGRGGVNAVRLIGSGLAMLTVGMATAITFSGGSTGLESGRVGWTIAAFAVVAVTTSLLLRNVLHADPGRRFPAAAAMRIDWRPLLLPIALVFAVSAAFSSFTKLEPYFGVHALGSATWGARIAVAFALGSLLLQPLWATLYARLPRRTLLTLLGVALLFSAIAFMRLAGISRPAALALGFAIGALNGGFGLLLWSWFADEAAQRARGRAGLAFAAFTAASKLSLAGAGVYVGHVLANLDYRGGQSGGLAPTMTFIALMAAVLALAAAWRPWPPRT